MKQSTREWIQKAELDFQGARALALRRKVRFHDLVCFHCQQSAEKYLKARLEEAGCRIPRTHDLGDLLDLLLPLEPLWAALRPALDALSDYAVDCRFIQAMQQTRGMQRPRSRMRKRPVMKPALPSASKGKPGSLRFRKSIETRSRGNVAIAMRAATLAPLLPL